MGYSPVYSTAFIEHTSTTPNTEFEVPAGFTAILRDVILYTEVGDEDASVGYYTATSGERIVVCALQALAINGTAEWQGRAVVTEGETILLIADGLALYSSVYVGGYLLQNSVS
jgi:hypothetical protein